MSRNLRWTIIVVAILFICLVAGLCLVAGTVAWRYAAQLVPHSLFIPPLERGEGTLRLWGHAPVTLDPAMVTDAYSAEYVVEIFSGLVTLDSDLQVVPDIAEQWEVDSEGRRYVFYLRPNAVFHDGTPVTAKDFKYSIERACSPALHSPVAMTYLGDIVGAAEFNRGEAEEITGIRVVNDHVLEITIDAPKVYFLAKLTYPTAFVVNRETVEKSTGFWELAVNGTGPFRLAHHDRDKIVLERNERFYNGPPRLERVEFVLSGGSPVSMYEDGELDIVEIGLADIERVLDPSNPLHAELSIVSEMSVQYLGMNTALSPFDDVKVRQAFAHAIDRAKLADVVMKRTVSPAAGILPPGIPGYNPALEGLSYDPEKAQRLITESRYGAVEDLPPITLHIGGDSGVMPRSVEAIRAMFQEALGVDIAVEESAWPVFLEDVRAGQYQMFYLGWIGDYPDPQNFLDVLFHSESQDNHTQYANPVVDALLEKARTEADSERRMALYQEAERIIVEDAPCIPLWHAEKYILTKPYVEGAVHAAAIFPWLKDVSIRKH